MCFYDCLYYHYCTLSEMTRIKMINQYNGALTFLCFFMISWLIWITWISMSTIWERSLNLITHSVTPPKFVICLLDFGFRVLIHHQQKILLQLFNTLRPSQNGFHFADNFFKCILLNEKVFILIKISLKFVAKGPINNIPSLVQIMAWRWAGDKPFF